VLLAPQNGEKASQRRAGLSRRLVRRSAGVSRTKAEGLAKAEGALHSAFQLRRVSTLRGVFEYGVWKDATPGPSAGSTRWELKRS